MILLHSGLRYGVDFAGGLLLQIRFSKPMEVSEVRSALETMGAKEAMVQNFGGANEFLIRVEKASDDIEAKSRSIQAALKDRFKDKALEIRRVEIVSKVGSDLKTKALWAVGLFLGSDLCGLPGFISSGYGSADRSPVP
jgi:preprotein translocase subunit SecF